MQTHLEVYDLRYSACHPIASVMSLGRHVQTTRKRLVVLVSVTALGATPDRLRAAARDVAAYLEGTRANRLTQPGSTVPPTAQHRPGAYYSDSAERAGLWRGQGTEALGATVDPDQLQRVLLGQDPVSGRQLVEAVGSAARAKHRPRPLPPGPADQLFSLPEAAGYIGVNRSYLWRVAQRHDHDAAATPGVSPTAAPTVPPTAGTSRRRATLETVDRDGNVMVTRAEIERFISTRRQPQVVIGYDVTFSAPKSLSIVWAVGDQGTRRLCEEAFEAGVARGMRYLEDQAIWVRRGRDREQAGGMIAASYRHSTNRALEPQLHEHVVIANMATAADGRVQTLDARGLFAHATTAGHLAEAEMQQYANQRGIAWTPTHRGIANVVGVPDEAIRAMSTRREQILTLAGELGTTSARGRQAAAVATRAPKDTSVDPASLKTEWRKRLDAAGFGARQIETATTADPPRPWSGDDTRLLHEHLAGSAGVTEQQAIFDRRDVICAIVDHTGGRLDADQVEAHADAWLGTDAVITLQQAPANAELIGREGKVTLAADVQWYTTPTMVTIEETIAAAYRNGHDQNAGIVPTTIIDTAIANWEQASGRRLGDDQAAMVRAICGSGDRFQAVVGPAGSGKTAALEVAAQAWHAAGYTVIGAAVNGTAAEVLQRSTGIESRTVAGLVTRLDTATTSVLADRTIVLVDEASTLDNRHHARLAHHVHAAGATMRTIGDPHQHGAVEAGGMWTHLVNQHPTRTPRLTENRRQAAPEMDDVRLANADYRAGRIAEAIARLDTNQRIVTAPTSSELLDQLAADWYVDHTATRRDGSTPSRMIAEHHHERRALNARAQALLSADGTLTGPGVRIGEATFHVGDTVIARAANRTLHPDGDTRNYVRNGTTGTITAIDGRAGHERLTVDFEHRGPITVPRAWLTEQIRPGVTGGLAPAYAVTSHAAQGDTYRAGRMLATDTSATEAVYVGLTRGTHDTRLYTVKQEPATLDSDPQLPRITDPRTATETLTEQLSRPKPTDLATVADPDIARVLYLARLPLPNLEASNDPLARRAAGIVADRLTTAARAHPDHAVLDHLGPRPTNSPARWDRAVNEVALYRSRWPSADIRVAPALPHVATADQRRDHERLVSAVHDARVETLSTWTTAELAAERRHHVAHIREVPHVDLGLLARDVQAATPGDRKRALQTLHRLSNQQQERSGHLGQIAQIDEALEPRIQRALVRPATYLETTLGGRPANDPRRWDGAADVIERYRHSVLGLEPDDGALSPRHPAIGPRPHNSADAAEWNRAHGAIERARLGHERLVQRL